MLQIKQICKQYKTGDLVQNALNNVSLNLRDNEFVAILGPSGSGKTTLLNIIGGLDRYDSGDLIINGISTKKYKDRDWDSYRNHTIGFVFQSYNLIPHQTVLANVELALTISGVSKSERRRRAKEALEKVELSHRMGHRPTELSGGQRKRIALVRTLLTPSDILILDEPTSYLDVRHKLEFLSILQKLCRERELTVILSLHELELAEKISDRILCVNGRAVDRIGTPEEVMTDGYITQLYGIRMGSYDEASSDMELAAPEGTPQVFVIAGAGSGRKDYRRLQRAGVPFATGILYENDLDYPVAKALAAEVIAEHPFEPVAQEKIQAAKKQLEKCNRVICCRENFGSLETYQRELLEYAEQLGKQIEKSENPEQRSGC